MLTLPRLLLLLGLVSLIPQLLFAQYRFERGLPPELNFSGTALCILQDQQGFLWIGSTDGLYRYDGHQIRSFRHQSGDSLSLSNNIVKMLVEGPRDNLWICTSAGVSVYQASSDQIRSLRFPIDSIPGPNGNLTSLLIDQKEQLWMGTHEGLFRSNLDGSNLVHFSHQASDTTSLPHNSVFDLYQDRRGRIWVGTFNGLGLYSGQDQTPFLTILPPADDSGAPPVSRFWEISEQADGSLYLGSNHGVFRVREQASGLQLERYAYTGPTAAALSGPFIQSISTDEPDRLWIGTWAGGLNELIMDTEQPDSFHIVHHTANDPQATDGYSLASNKIQFAYRDRSNVLWVGTGNSLEKAAPYPWKFGNQYHWPDRPNSLSNEIIKAILRDRNGNLWVGTRDGLNLLRAEQLAAGNWDWQHITHQVGQSGSLSHNNISALYEDRQGAIWVSTYSGLNYLAPGQNLEQPRFQSFKVEDGLPDNWVHQLHEFAPHQYWVASYFRTAKMYFNPDQSSSPQFQIFPVGQADANQIINEVCYAITQDRFGYPWIATAGGLSRCIDSSGTGRFVNYQHDPKDPGSLCGNRLSMIFKDSQERIWCATRSGLSLIQQSHPDSVVRFQSWGIADGFRNDVIQSITEDAEGLLWLGTNDGLIHFEPEAAIAGRAPVRRIYDANDGLASSSQVFRASYFDQQSGNVYIGTGGGLSYCQPTAMSDNTLRPAVVLTQLKILNEEVLPQAAGQGVLSKAIQVTDTIRLQYWHNVIELAYAALDFNRPQQNQYRYRLLGFDPNWVEVDQRHSATYTNLSAGWYCFELQGSNHDGKWNNESRQLWIKVLPPPWLSWWAYLIYAGLIVAAIYGLIRLRTRRLQEASRLQKARFEAREQIRQKNAEDFHDELGHRLTKISLYLELAKRASGQAPDSRVALNATAAEQPEVTNLLEKIQQQTVALSSGTRDLIWSLDPTQDNLFSVLSRLQQFGDQLFEHSPTTFNSQGIHRSQEKISLTAEQKKQLLLLFKEAMHNCLKYAQARQAKLHFTLTAQRATLRFIDDGVGFESETVAKGYGLGNMAKRAAAIGGELQLESKIGEGTRVSLSFEL